MRLKIGGGGGGGGGGGEKRETDGQKGKRERDKRGKEK